MNQTPAFAFFVNFVLLDGLLYLFFVGLFFALSRNEVPSKRVTPENYFIHVSPPQQLEPRRSGHIASSSLTLHKEVSNVSESPFPHIPYVRKIVLPTKGRQYKVMNYVSTREADAVQRPWETSRREKKYKRCQLVEHFQPEFNDVARTHSCLSKPCSLSTKTFYVNGRFNYFKNSC